jgi:hypothetical protein
MNQFSIVEYRLSSPSGFIGRTEEQTPTKVSTVPDTNQPPVYSVSLL